MDAGAAVLYFLLRGFLIAFACVLLIGFGAIAFSFTTAKVRDYIGLVAMGAILLSILITMAWAAIVGVANS